MKKVFAIILSFLLVVSNISLTYATHFCGGKAIESQLMLGSQDLTCGMIMPESTCENMTDECSDPNPSELNNNCCDNEYIQLTTDDDFNTVSSVELPQLEFVVTFIYNHFNPEFVSNKTLIEFHIEAPPLVKQNIQVLHQVFII